MKSCSVNTSRPYLDFRLKFVSLTTTIFAFSPLIDHVIHYSFPPSAKLFVHRSGRAARAGRIGYCWGLVDTEELPYMVDLYLFLGKYGGVLRLIACFDLFTVIHACIVFLQKVVN